MYGLILTASSLFPFEKSRYVLVQVENNESVEGNYGYFRKTNIDKSYEVIYTELPLQFNYILNCYVISGKIIVDNRTKQAKEELSNTASYRQFLFNDAPQECTLPLHPKHADYLVGGHSKIAEWQGLMDCRRKNDKKFYHLIKSIESPNRQFLFNDPPQECKLPLHPKHANYLVGGNSKIAEWQGLMDCRRNNDKKLYHLIKSIESPNSQNRQFLFNDPPKECKLPRHPSNANYLPPGTNKISDWQGLMDCRRNNYKKLYHLIKSLENPNYYRSMKIMNGEGEQSNKVTNIISHF